MTSDPAVLFYTSDWLSGTLLLSYEQKGQYIDLLCIQHQIYPEHIPKDRMMIVCLSYDNPVFKKFAVDDNGNYYNERMEIEIEKRVSYCESRRLASHARKKLRDRTNYHTMYRMMGRMGNENDNENKEVIQEEEGVGETKNSKVVKSVSKLPEREAVFKAEVLAITDYPREMLDGFFNYWSEADRLGKKMRFEREKTWDLKKRLANWFSRSKDYGGGKTGGRQKLEYERNTETKYDHLSPTPIGDSA